MPKDKRYHGDFNDSIQNGLQDGACGKHQTDPLILAYPHEVELRHGEAHSKIVDGMAQKCNAKLATGSHILGNLFMCFFIEEFLAKSLLICPINQLENIMSRKMPIRFKC
jgi:hypothetical protein